MSSVDVDKIYKELLRIYSARYVNPKTILNYRIIELKREGKTREEAILALYEENGKITRAEAERLEEAVKRKKAEEEKEKLEESIREKKAEKEEAVRKKKEEEAIEKQIQDYEKRIERLTILFSDGEISEESYERATRTIEKSIDKLRKRARALRKKTTTPSTKKTPSRPPHPPPEKTWIKHHPSYPTYEKKRARAYEKKPMPVHMKVNYLALIAGVLALVSLALAWWTASFTFSTTGLIPMRGHVEYTVYLHRAVASSAGFGTAETFEVSVGRWFSQLTLLFVLIGGLATIAGAFIVGETGKNILNATCAIFFFSILIYAAGFQSEMPRAFIEEWEKAGLYGMPEVGLFSSGSTTLTFQGISFGLEYSSSLNIGFGLALIAAVLTFVSSWIHPEAEVKLEAPSRAQVDEEKERVTQLPKDLAPRELEHIPADHLVNRRKGSYEGELVLTREFLSFKPKEGLRKGKELSIPLENIIDITKEDHLLYSEIHVHLRDGGLERFIMPHGEKRDRLIDAFRSAKEQAS